MMFQDDMMPKPAPAASDDKDQSSGNSQKATSRPPAEIPRCPRCDSPNTKFCYYNNYSLSQPRYFCKTCRRYWTKGGALRNIPIGGGSRKNKKISKPSASSSSIFSGDSMDSAASSSYLDHINGFKFSNIGLSSGMDFHGNNNFATTFSPINHYQQLSTNSSFGNISRPLISNTSTSCFGLENFSGNSSAGAFMGYNFPLSSPSGLKQDHGTAQVLLDQDRDIKNNDHIVASSIESLSSINQDLHWKLQQQRLGMSMVFGGENVMANQKELSTCTIIPQKPQPILFKNLEISSSANDHAVNVHQGVVDLRKDNDSQSGPNGGLATEWFFDHNSNYSLVTPTQTNSSNTGIDGANEAWCNLYQHAPLP